ncbi:MAG: exodeoxyribonuclease VII small subunit [Clostridium sp.]|jgi:exodeoxyribonuclease VII small subunit|nr:exodeoxyribonuclease VII small subunit [Clostridium sp.]
MEGKERLPETEKEQLDSCSIEELFERLNQVIGSLEDGSSSLEDSFRYYEEGMRLVKACSGKIDRVEKQILVIDDMGGEYGA